MARIVSLRRPAALPSAPSLEAPSGASRRSVRPAFIALVTSILLVSTIVVATIAQLRASRELSQLPSGLRHDVYTRSLAELRTDCLQPAASAGPLRIHCLEVAHFVEQLPECTGDCRVVVYQVLPAPVRK
jgi:hypothetical protein